jgi:signal transduction histidine kinase
LRIAIIERVLSLGESDAIPHRLARHVRVTNALALIAFVLCITGIPLDTYGASAEIVLVDVVCAAMFASCWWLNSRNYRTAARLMLMAASDGIMFASLAQLGGLPELRTVFFPLVVQPFLVFSTNERGWLALFVAVPVAGYFILGSLPPDTNSELVVKVNQIYAPVLSFTMLVGGTYTFAAISESSQAKLLLARTRAAQNARLVALGEMSTGIAHEVRNPLAAIHMAATQIAENPSDPTQVTQLGQRIQRVAMRASRIIESLRSFSRDAAGDPFVITPVQRVISDALELCGKRLAEHAIDLRVAEVPADIVVACRSVQLTQVLVNLLSNAYDAVGDAAERWVKIEVQPSRDTANVEIAVVDSGRGIPAHVRARLFEPFFTTKPPDRGTGIGLNLSREMIEAHNGTLTLDAESPQTRFVIRVPVVQPTTT